MAASEIRGRLYNRLKKSPAESGSMKGSVPQNEGRSHTAERLAEQHGVSRATIERDGQFAEAVETLKPYACSNQPAPVAWPSARSVTPFPP